MKNFDNIQQIIERIPNCIICQKPLKFSIINNTYHASENINFIMRDGLLVSQHRDIKSIINPIDNTISFNEPLIKKFRFSYQSYFYIKLSCRTCFVRTYYSVRQQTKKLHELFLYNENVKYTSPKNKIINIDYYYNHNLLDEISFKYNYKYIKCPKIDLTRIKNLKQLNNKIKTILTFS